VDAAQSLAESEPEANKNVSAVENESQGRPSLPEQTRGDGFRNWYHRQADTQSSQVIKHGFGMKVDQNQELESSKSPPRLLKKDVLSTAVQVAKTRDNHPLAEPKTIADYILVERTSSIERMREKLPILTEQHSIIDALSENDCIIVYGPTGSGKSTQMPQFLYEAGFSGTDTEQNGLIGITEPRRVAAISMAKRVAEELGNVHGKRVAYQVRFSSSLQDNTRIKFQTEGILLNEIREDFLLRKYAVIIIDEAHERSVNSDLLVGLLSRICRLRREKHGSDGVRLLKVIIMSATLDVHHIKDNKLLFNPAPQVVELQSRQFEVRLSFSTSLTVQVNDHYARVTPSDYVEASFHTIKNIHLRMPAGGEIWSNRFLISRYTCVFAK